MSNHQDIPNGNQLTFLSHRKGWLFCSHVKAIGYKTVAILGLGYKKQTNSLLG